MRSSVALLFCAGLTLLVVEEWELAWGVSSYSNLSNPEYDLSLCSVLDFRVSKICFRVPPWLYGESKRAQGS